MSRQHNWIADEDMHTDVCIECGVWYRDLAAKYGVRAALTDTCVGTKGKAICSFQDALAWLRTFKGLGQDTAQPLTTPEASRLIIACAEALRQEAEKDIRGQTLDRVQEAIGQCFDTGPADYESLTMAIEALRKEGK